MTCTQSLAQIYAEGAERLKTELIEVTQATAYVRSMARVGAETMSAWDWHVLRRDRWRLKKLYESCLEQSVSIANEQPYA